MTYVATAAESRAFEAWAARAGISNRVLMENAGRGAVDVIATLRGDELGRDKVLVVCGQGNNGGDGFVVARRLRTLGVDVRVLFIGAWESLQGDAKANAEAYRAIGGEFTEDVGSPTLVIDALFGTGLSRAIEGRARDILLACNGLSACRVALDLPSGLDCDRGVVYGIVFRAHHTVTFAFPKLGLYSNDGAECVGEVHVADIGLPPKFETSACLIDDAWVRSHLSSRDAAAHKYKNGHVGVIGGRHGKSGAAQLACLGAMRVGAGLVTVSDFGDFGHFEPEFMRHALRAENVREDLTAFYTKKRVLVVGPGLLRDKVAETVVSDVLATWAGPCVIDADALHLLPEGMLGNEKNVLTPHAGEMASILGATTEHVLSNRFEVARQVAANTGGIVVFKGARTVVAAPNGLIRILASASPALGTAGSGDVLSGMIGGLLCSQDPFDAATVGVFLHAAAAAEWAKKNAGADRGMKASEIAELLPHLIGESIFPAGKGVS